MIAVGSTVFLKGCPYGQPGTVVRIERNRAVILWPDLDYLARHNPESLMLAPEKGGIDAAALARVVAKDKPTLFIDELDAQMSDVRKEKAR
jgi:hypothetical protein